MFKFALYPFLWLLTMSLAIAADQDVSADAGNQNAVTDAAGPLVVYSGRSEALVEPILEQFEKDTGIKIVVRYNDTPTITTQLLNERSNTPADVLFFQDPGYLGLLATADLLEPLDDSLLDQVEPRYRDPDNMWVGASGRLRVIVYDPTKYDPSELPKTLDGLIDPKYKGKVGVAFNTPGLQAHITALRHLWGEEKTNKWLQDLKENDVQSYATSPGLVSAVANGEIELGWTNHYYLYRLKQVNPDLHAENYIFPPEGRDGNLMFTSGLAITKNSKRKQQAQQLINYLLSEKAQAYLRCEVFEYQTRKDFTVTNETCRKFGFDVPKVKEDVSMMLPDINKTELAVIDQSELADLGPTITELQKLKFL